MYRRHTVRAIASDCQKILVDEVDKVGACGEELLTSISSKLSCWLMYRNTFFLLLSCISPAIKSSSKMKYAFWKLKMMSSSQTLP